MMIWAGSEARLADCPQPGIGVENCAHREDAEAVCNNKEGELCRCLLIYIVS